MPLDVPMPPTSGHEAAQADLPTEGNQPLPMAADRALGSRAGLAVASLMGLCLFVAGTPLLFWYAGPAATPPTDSSPADRLAALRRDERARLGGYRLIDSTNRVYQVPIDQAKRKLIESGYKSEPAAKPPTK